MKTVNKATTLIFVLPLQQETASNASKSLIACNYNQSPIISKTQHTHRFYNSLHLARWPNITAADAIASIDPATGAPKGSSRNINKGSFYQQTMS
ncbi:hypothetical protein G6F42_018622 [Rhizopus arrhizus]|nr:hypothetical protein G6F42_018622 [Rhizopus arrhizus]